MSDIIVITEADDGQRLDRWLKKKCPEAGFAMIQKVLRTGQVRVDGKRAKGDARLATGQSVRLPPQMSGEVPIKKSGISEKDSAMMQDMVIYSDKDIIALNKPHGLAVQGGSKIGGRHIDALLDALKASPDDERPHLVHRLDKDTSGILLLARHTKAARALGDIFRGREIRKYYWAVTAPAPEEDSGMIKNYLVKAGRAGDERMRVARSSSTPDAKSAVTLFQVMEKIGKGLAWVAFWPRTGRTHQIRVHAAESLGTPLVGDFKYDPDQEFLNEHAEVNDVLHLHARRLIFKHPFTGKKVDITAPLGREMKNTFAHFGFDPSDKTDPFADVEA